MITIHYPILLIIWRMTDGTFIKLRACRVRVNPLLFDSSNIHHNGSAHEHFLDYRTEYVITRVQRESNFNTDLFYSPRMFA